MLEIQQILKLQSRNTNTLVTAVKKLFLYCLLFVGQSYVSDHPLTHFQDN